MRINYVTILKLEGLRLCVDPRCALAEDDGEFTFEHLGRMTTMSTSEMTAIDIPDFKKFASSYAQRVKTALAKEKTTVNIVHRYDTSDDAAPAPGLTTLILQPEKAPPQKKRKRKFNKCPCCGCVRKHEDDCHVKLYFTANAVRRNGDTSLYAAAIRQYNESVQEGWEPPA